MHVGAHDIHLYAALAAQAAGVAVEVRAGGRILVEAHGHQSELGDAAAARAADVDGELQPLAQQLEGRVLLVVVLARHAVVREVGPPPEVGHHSPRVPVQLDLPADRALPTSGNDRDRRLAGDVHLARAGRLPLPAGLGLAPLGRQDLTLLWRDVLVGGQLLLLDIEDREVPEDHRLPALASVAIARPLAVVAGPVHPQHLLGLPVAHDGRHP
mmetsp:Transcript_19393/g.50980  ORF Transcript_19393/g.50980 Transcript_19393/m.50980 type:complete len:213 (+) Transcript_19393:1824-2462(+)